MEKILSVTTEYICLSEEEATNLVNEKRDAGVIEKSSINYKKETKKKAEHWIVVLKERISFADQYVLLEGEE